MSDNKNSQQLSWENLLKNALEDIDKASEQGDGTIDSLFDSFDYSGENSSNSYYDIFAGSSSRNDDYQYSFADDDYIYDPKSFSTKTSQSANQSQNAASSFNQRTAPKGQNASSRTAQNARSQQNTRTAQRTQSTQSTAKKSGSKNNSKKKKQGFLGGLFSKKKKKKPTNKPSQKRATASQTASQQRGRQNSPASQGVNAQRNQEQRAQGQRNAQQRSQPQRNGFQANTSRPPEQNRQNTNRQRTNLNDQRKEQKRIEKLNNDYSKAVLNGNKSGNEARAMSAQKKRKSNKFHIVVIVVCVVCTIVAAVLTFCFVKGFPIASISVEGNTVYTNEEILKTANINISDNILRVRQRKTNNTLKIALPYIESVKVDYVLPDTLRLEIVETQDKMYLVIENKYLCLDQNSKILSTTKKKLSENKYKITGLKQQEFEVGHTFEPTKDNGNAEKYEIALKIIEALESVELTAKAEINLENLDEITVKYKDNILMKFNKDTDAKKQLKIIKSVVDQKLATKIKSTFDLRFEKPYGKDGDFE